MGRRILSRAISCAAVGLCVLAPLFAQGISGREGFELPPRTDAGSWAGTWYYVARDSKVAIWIREERGRPEIKLRYLNTSNAESFETDWNGHVQYRFDGKPGEFAFELTERDPKTIRGTWHWALGHGELRRTENARVTIYRAADGRALVMNFEDLERFIGLEAGTLLAYPQVWTFRKASNYERRWEELPF